MVAPELIGKTLVRKYSCGEVKYYTITETEAYRGINDLACHASKGRTPRTEVMFHSGGCVYVYLIYGMHWMLNIVTGKEGDASAVLIRALKGFNGPGRVGRELNLDRSFYGEILSVSQRIWIENSTDAPIIKTLQRIGINYAGEPWISKPWRYVMEI
jgi:DNA-3-methyladenine glycosylase